MDLSEICPKFREGRVRLLQCEGTAPRMNHHLVKQAAADIGKQH